MKKASDFTWGPPQEEAVKFILEYIEQFSNLIYINADNPVVTDILFIKGYGNWNIFVQQPQIKPIGFYSKRFPWSEAK